MRTPRRWAPTAAAFVRRCSQCPPEAPPGLSAEWRHREEQPERPVVLRRPSSPHRRPAILFRHAVSDSVPADCDAVSAAQLGTAAPLYKVTAPTCEYFAVRLALLKAGFKRVAEVDSPLDVNAFWGKSWPASHTVSVDRSRPSHRFQKVNHFAGSHRHLGCKLGMENTLQSHQSSIGASGADDTTGLSAITPRTWRFPGDGAAFRAHLEKPAGRQGRYIVKPARGSCGRGIHIVPAGDPLLGDVIRGTAQLLPAPPADPAADAPVPRPALRSPMVVVQEYLEDPMLIDGRKFDFRLYVAVTSFDPLRCYRHARGLVRFAAQSYVPGDITQYGHLTNYSVGRRLERQRQGSDGAEPAVDLGLKWTLPQFTAHCAGAYGAAAAAKLWSDIDDIIVRALLAAQRPLLAEAAKAPQGQSDGSFELLGFDLMVDASLRPFLVEVNTLPSLESSTELDYNVKTRVATDLLNLASFELFDRSPHAFAASGFDAPAPPGSRHVPSVWSSTQAAGTSCDSFWHGLSAQQQADDVIAQAGDELRFAGEFNRLWPTARRIRELGEAQCPAARTPVAEALWESLCK